MIVVTIGITVRLGSGRVRVRVRVTVRGGLRSCDVHTTFSIPQLMQRVRHQGDCHGISAATEWDPTATDAGTLGGVNHLSHL